MPESLWAQFGIAGASLGVLWFAIKSLVARNDDADKRHTQERSELVQIHREERAEWRAEASDARTRSDGVVRELTQAIKELKQ